jgi:hypothetical protein
MPIGRIYMFFAQVLSDLEQLYSILRGKMGLSPQDDLFVPFFWKGTKIQVIR